MNIVHMAPVPFNLPGQIFAPLYQKLEFLLRRHILPRNALPDPIKGHRFPVEKGSPGMLLPAVRRGPVYQDRYDSVLGAVETTQMHTSLDVTVMSEI
jgi:hypothetical protein